MPLPKPSAVRFEISVRAKLTREALALLRKEVITEAVEHWLENGIEPHGFKIRLTIWQRNRKREISEIDDSTRGKALRAALRRALKSGALHIRQMGNSR